MSLTLWLLSGDTCSSATSGPGLVLPPFMHVAFQTRLTDNNAPLASLVSKGDGYLCQLGEKKNVLLPILQHENKIIKCAYFEVRSMRIISFATFIYLLFI